ncbi:GGDEF domain-containing protein [Psychrobium sp. 1_MG-2023]|uniref:GGDEF domain-containing protein n=1 Tax=Psychrobium sp. 1_MG-2023 TaxID=3062624 RepID=UPI002732E3D6|nr:GGDEF domain-containing protein [Psychrobium sp. 1_MG-2023]MDP2560772.1 GGDEF domain-containing protein [Psychrobium sp. 1_MG-2023]
MSSVHPKLIESLVNQTPRAMVAMLIVSYAYFWIFMPFVPLAYLTIWLAFQVLLAAYRLHNAKSFTYYLAQQDQNNLTRNEKYFIASNVFQAFMWNASSVLSIIYAPQPFELVSFVMSIGIITAAALSMSSLYRAYLTFFFCMIIPQIVIMIYYGQHQHTGLVVLAIIYIPATILLSKAIHDSRLSSIQAHDELKRSVEELHHLSTIDNLTNVHNRRYFFEVSQKLIALATREKTSVSLLMLDIDFFKSINDNYGHQAGDFILKELANSIGKTLRESDVFARIGGEEFTILLNRTSLDEAANIAENIRNAIETKSFIKDGLSMDITISIGISELCQKHASIESLYQHADQQLYIAKNNGRNRVAYKKSDMLLVQKAMA